MLLLTKGTVASTSHYTRQSLLLLLAKPFWSGADSLAISTLPALHPSKPTRASKKLHCRELHEQSMSRHGLAVLLRWSRPCKPVSMSETSIPETVVDRMYNEFRALLGFLADTGEISLINSVNENFRKSLLLCAASYFETVVGECVVKFADECSPGANGIIGAFVRNKALSRQYHTWFAWNSNNANQFFGLFGDGFRKFMDDRLLRNADLRLSISAFMEIGRERNRLVHQDFGSFALEKTGDEIYNLYKTADTFVQSIYICLHEFR
jgi:hypothetical protein